MFDLPRYVVDRLQRAGVAQVEDLALCTYADRRSSIPIAAPRIARNPITDGTSTRLLSHVAEFGVLTRGTQPQSIPDRRGGPPRQ